MIGQARPAAARRSAHAWRPRGPHSPGTGLMQPPTNTASPSPLGDEDALYRAHDRELHRAVAHAVRAPGELVDDACQTAWAMLLRTQPERYAIFGWLRVVAI